MKTAVIQLSAGSNKEKNLNRAIGLVQKAIQKRAKFILLPEVFSFRGPIKTAQDRRQHSENIPGPTIKTFMEVARKRKVSILVGTILEKSKTSSKIYNTSTLVNSRGKIVAKYRKTNLFNAVIGKQKLKESEHFLTGQRASWASLNGFRVGLSICYDLRFPKLYQSYLNNGIHILCVPSAFTKKTGEAHWETLLRARAIETQCYVCAPNQTGKDSRGVPGYGTSMIVDPWGRVLAKASKNKEEIIFANLKEDVIKQAQRVLPGIRKR